MNRNKGEILIFLFWFLVVINILWFGYGVIRSTVQDEETDGQNKVSEHTAINETDFYYEQLSEEQKEVYNTLKEGLVERSNKITLTGCNSEDVVKVWEAVLMDHSEIFWVHEYRYSVQRGETVVCEVLPSYIYTKEETEEIQSKIEEFTSEFVSGISKNESDYNKILYTYETIIKRTEYDLEAPNNQYIDSVILGKKSVCAGYAKTTKYLLNQLGIECIYVVGNVKKEDGESLHAWNIVTCDGVTYFIDSTWGDPVYQDSVDTETSRYQEIDYEYFCCNEELLSVTHTLNSDYNYPACTSLDSYYFVVNNRYFTEYNAEEIDALIKKDIEEGKKSTILKFANDSVFSEAKTKVLDIHLKTGKEFYQEQNGIDDTKCYYSEYNNKIVIYWE